MPQQQAVPFPAMPISPAVKWQMIQISFNNTLEDIMMEGGLADSRSQD